MSAAKPRPCYACDEDAMGLAWHASGYYFACYSHRTARPTSTPRDLAIEAGERLRRGAP